MVGTLERWRDRGEQGRNFRRTEMALSAALLVYGQRHDCEVINISPGGACIRIDDGPNLAEGGTGQFELRDYGQIPARVCYVVSGGIGLEFTIDGRGHEALASWLEPQETPTPG